MKKNRLITRRNFIRQAVAGTATVALTPMTSIIAKASSLPEWPRDAASYKFYMIGNGHIDPVWLWPWHEGIAVTLSTFRSALDRMKETPDFVFTSSSAQFYQWVADNDPRMLNEIRQRIAEGRWSAVGGWWVEPDVNIPSGEAMARQGLYGQLTLRRLLGIQATTAFNPDSFGHTGTLPQIISLQGMHNYVFMRPASHEKTLPADLFWWESPDGTRVLTYRIPFSYTDEREVNRRIEQILEKKDTQPMKSYMAFYGVGDHGGGPTKLTIQSIEALKKVKDAPKVFYSTVDRYFKDMREDKTLNLPVVKDDLQFHAVGCYTAESAIKKGNRQSETALVNAEKITAVGSFVWKAAYPKDDFTNAWKKVLFLQFHDSMAGTSLFVHSEDARNGYGYAIETAHHALFMAAQKLEWQIPAEDTESKYIIAINPHAWEVNEFIEYELGFFGGPSGLTRAEDEKGNSLPHQWVFGAAEAGNRRKLAVQVAIPPFGYRQIRILPGEPAKINYPVTATANGMENEFLKITFTSDGTFTMFDKVTGKEVFAGSAGGCRAVVMDDPSDTWSHAIKSYTNEIGAFGKATFTVIENGPMRATIRVKSSYNDSWLSIDWLLYAGCRQLDARVTLNWHERRKMLKFSFPVNIESPVATFETPYGHIVRQPNGDERPGQQWIDLSGKDNGFTVINDAKYGYDVNGNDMHISISRSAVYAHHDPTKLEMNREYLWMDQGIQTFKLKLIPHKGDWKEANIPRMAETFLSPPTVVYQGIHPGSMPKADSWLAMDAANIIVSSIKLSEEGDDLIVRCIETHGKPTTATLDFRLFNRQWTGNFKPCEIKTLRIDRNSKEIKEVNILEEEDNR